MTPSEENNPEPLLAKFFDGVLTPAERSELLARLRTDPQMLQELREHLKIANRLSCTLDASRSDEAFVQAVLFRIEHITTETPDPFEEKVAQRISPPSTISWPRFGLLWCAGIAALLMVGIFFLRNDQRPPALVSSQVERVASVVLVRDLISPSVSLVEKQHVYPGSPMRFDGGVIRLDFENGAIVSIQGPADFTITSGRELELRRGRLNAYCPETAYGFRVLTPTADLIDRGTSFGVDATDPAQSRMLVFYGAVDVSSRQRVSDTFRVSTGEAVSVSQRDAPQSAAFDPSAYEQLWPVTSGIIATAGGIRPPSPDVPLRLMKYENDDFVLAIPEKRNVHLTAPLQVNPLPTEGQIRYTSQHPHESIALTQPVRSYICYYNPVGTPRLLGFKHFRGSITFDSPVLAVIYGMQQLQLSDALFQHQPFVYPVAMRGLEDNEGEAPPDAIYLSPDRRTLTLDIYTGPHSDQIRVIVAEDPRP